MSTKPMPGITVSLEPLNRMPGLASPHERVLSALHTEALIKQQDAAVAHLRSQQRVVEAYIDAIRTYAVLDQAEAIRASAAAGVLSALETDMIRRKVARIAAETTLIQAEAAHKDTLARAAIAAARNHQVLAEEQLKSANVDDAVAAVDETTAERRAARAAEMRASYKPSDPAAVSRLEQLRGMRAELDALRREEAASGRDTTDIVNRIELLDAQIREALGAVRSE